MKCLQALAPLIKLLTYPSQGWISNVHLIITELSGEATIQIRLKITVIAASVYQMRRSDANQQLEDG